MTSITLNGDQSFLKKIYEFLFLGRVIYFKLN